MGIGAPRLSMIIPAYNEGTMVRRAVDACAWAEYPRGRLEIIVVNDGSTDDTGAHVELARQDRPDPVQAVHPPRNGGTRIALAESFARPIGDLIVTAIESDAAVRRTQLCGVFDDGL